MRESLLKRCKKEFQFFCFKRIETGHHYVGIAKAGRMRLEAEARSDLQPTPEVTFTTYAAAIWVSVVQVPVPMSAAPIRTT